MRMIMGGKVPGGMRDMARLAIATTSASARAHVGAREERQLEQATCWMLCDSISLDAVDVLEEQFELVDDQSFHLGRGSCRRTAGRRRCAAR